MTITHKTSQEIEIMAEGGVILAQIHNELRNFVEVGMTTQDIEDKAEVLFKKFQVEPSFKGYKGYPAILCTSVNEEVVHAIPGSRRLENGDIISIDCGVFHKGFHTDSAITVLLGDVSPEVRQFVQTVQLALDRGIESAIAGNTIGHIGAAIQETVEKQGYSVIRELIGHGVGHKLHEPPEVPNFGKSGSGIELSPGTTIAIEPIISMGNGRMRTLPDHWTIVTEDNTLAAQIEHTIAINEHGTHILTRTD